MSSTHHARQRMRERFDVPMTPELEVWILERIKSRKAIVETENKRENTSRYRMSYEGKILRVVFSWRTQKIITVMKSRYL